MQILNKTNYRVYAVSPSDAFVKRLKEQGVDHINIKISRSSLNPLQDFFLLLRLICICKRYKPYIVQLYTIKPNIYGPIAARIAGIKNVYNNITGLGYIFIGKSLRRVILRRFIEILYRFSLSFSKHVFFQNNDDQQYFIAHNLVNMAKTSIIPGSGVNTRHFMPIAKKSTEDKIVFILVSRMIADKGISEYVEAAYRAKKHFDNSEYLLLGPIDTTYPNYISPTMLDKWNEEGIVQYLGATDDVRPYLAKADVIVLPSYREGLPVSILEGMAMGMPVITSDAIGCKETVRNGKNGFLVPVKDPEALASAMMRFLQEPSLIKKMGRESRKLAVSTFDVKIVSQLVLDKYPSL